MITQEQMNEAVDKLSRTLRLLVLHRIKFHDHVESNGWKLWITHHAGQDCVVDLVGSVSGFRIDLRIIPNGLTSKNIPVEDQALAVIFLDMVKKSTDGIQVVIERDSRGTVSNDGMLSSF